MMIATELKFCIKYVICIEFRGSFFCHLNIYHLLLLHFFKKKNVLELDATVLMESIAQGIASLTKGCVNEALCPYFS